MKKAYIIPCTEVELMTEEQTILASSPKGFDNTLNENGTDQPSLSREMENDLWSY